MWANKTIGAVGGTAVALAIDFSLIRINQVVFAGHVVHVKARLRDNVIGVVEFLFLRQMTDVAGMDHEGWLLRQGIDLGDRLFQCPKRVRISWFIEADMAVADLQERQATGFRRLRLAHDAERVRHTARNRPQHTRATPSHAFQHLAPAKAVSMVEFTHCESPLSRWFPAGTATRLARARFDERRIYSRFGKEFDDGQGRLFGVTLWQDTAIHSDGLIYSLKVSVFGSHQRANVDSLANDGGASF